MTMITKGEIRQMIISEVAQAREEIAARKSSKLTRDRIREIVLEEAAALKAARMPQLGGDMMITRKISLVEAIMGDELEEAGPGIILSNPRDPASDEVSQCTECGSMYETPVANCKQCGAKLEYVSRGLSGLGKNAGVYEGKKKGGMPKTPEAAKRMVDRLARHPGPTWGDVTQHAKNWGAENPEAYAATLLRMSGGIADRKRKKGG